MGLVGLLRVLIGLNILKHIHYLMLKLFLLNPDSPSHRVKLIFNLIFANSPYRLV